MAWWNPLSWFASYDPATAKASEVLAKADVIEDGKAESVEVIKDGIAAGDKYLFEVQTVAATGEVIYVVPLGEEKSPLGLSDRKAPFQVMKALLTLEEAARLKTLSKSSGGDGKAKTLEQVAAEAVPEVLPPEPPETMFRAEALAKARPDQVIKALEEEPLEK